jgi:transposase
MYTKDAQTMCIQAYMQLKSTRKTAKLLGVSKSSVNRWVRKSPVVARARSARKVTDQAVRMIEDIVRKNPLGTPDMIRKSIFARMKLHISTSTVRFWMRRSGLTRKKTTKFNRTAASPEKRKNFAERIKYIDKERVVSIDESSFYFSMKPAYGYCHTSQRIRTPVTPGGRTRYSLLMAVTNERVVGWVLKKGSMKTPDLVDFVSNLDTDERDVFLLDNASVHVTNPVRDAILARGFDPCFLAPYSPEFQPIEHCFSVLKTAYRQMREDCVIPSAEDTVLRVRNAIQNLTSEGLSNTFDTCWERAASLDAFGEVIEREKKCRVRGRAKGYKENSPP